MNHSGIPTAKVDGGYDPIAGFQKKFSNLRIVFSCPSENSSASPPSELERLRTRLLAHFRKEMRNSEVAEDLTQETMLAVHAALDKGQQLRLIENFAFRVGFRVQYGYFRRAYRETPTISFEDLQYEPTSSQPGEEMASSDNSQYIQRLMEVIREKLSGAEQHVLALYYQGETQKSIAATLDMPVGTIGSHLSRGRGRLLAHLVEDDPELLGGMNIINQAWSDALTDTPPPTEAEIAAWAKRKPVEHFRAACLKMAKHLPSPLTDVSK